MDRKTRQEAIADIARIANENPGGKIMCNGLGFRREGVPGTGGGTFAVSYVSGRRNRKNGKNYIMVDFC